VPLPLITEAVFARVLSSLKVERVAASRQLEGPANKTFSGDRDAFIAAVGKALYLSKIVSYAQGFAQLRAASDEYKWQLDYGTIAQIWRGGCIIRARFLQNITDAYAENPGLANLLLAPYFRDIARTYQVALRDVVSAAIAVGVPVPCFSSAIAYYDGYRSERLPANLLQAQRDFFGAHTFERIDEKGSFHAEWS
jgi:6-phosphogluconate dehydrogenase